MVSDLLAVASAFQSPPLLASGSPAGIRAAPVVASAQEFGYRGEIDPDYRDTLNPDWAACGSGEIQSPVDLRSQRTYPRLDASYSESTGRIFNNGHTVEIEVDSGANTLLLDGVAYELAQFHFLRRPSKDPSRPR